jgi:hypothetical protein
MMTTTTQCQDPACPSYGQMGAVCICATPVSGAHITPASAADFLRQIGARFDDEAAYARALAAVALMLTRRVM